MALRATASCTKLERVSAEASLMTCIHSRPGAADLDGRDHQGFGATLASATDSVVKATNEALVDLGAGR